MYRNEMLEKLHSIQTSVALTALTSEGALECIYVTATGTKYEWIGLYDWPAYSLQLPEDFDQILLKQKLSNNLCDASMIAGTEIEKLYSDYLSAGRSSISLEALLSQLANVSTLNNSALYALFTENGILFFGSYKQFESAFEAHYCDGVTPWESYADQELASWLERIENEFDGIPLNSYAE